MLVLSRRVNEEITVDLNGTTAVLTVVAIQGDKVRLGVTAPREVAIRRSELAPLDSLLKPGDQSETLTACG